MTACARAPPPPPPPARYTYYSLAYFLAKKAWLDPFADDAAHPSIVCEHVWPEWAVFWLAAAQILSCAVDGKSSESCDCHRTRVGCSTGPGWAVAQILSCAVDGKSLESCDCHWTREAVAQGQGGL